MRLPLGEQDAQGEGGLLAGRVGGPDEQGFNIGRWSVNHLFGDFADDALLNLLVPMLAQDAHCAGRSNHRKILHLASEGHMIEPIGDMRGKAIFILLMIIGLVQCGPTKTIALLLGSRRVAVNIPVLWVWLIFPIFSAQIDLRRISLIAQEKKFSPICDEHKCIMWYIHEGLTRSPLACSSGQARAGRAAWGLGRGIRWLTNHVSQHC